MLKRIYLHNFKTFVNFEWCPPAAGVVVGDNGVGKSALLEALWSLLDIVVHGRTLDQTPLHDARTAWLDEQDQVIEIEVETGRAGGPPDNLTYRLESRFAGYSGFEIVEELAGSDGTLYRSSGGSVELFGDDPTPEPRATIPYNSRQSFLAALDPRPDNLRITSFRRALASIAAIKPDPLKLREGVALESRILFRDLSNFAGWYRTRVQEDPDAVLLHRDDLLEAIPGFSGLRFEAVTAEVKTLRARFGFDGLVHELPWESLSDGQRLLVALYGAFRFSFGEAGLVVLDEVENFVAPGEIQPWFVKVLDAASERGTQVLAVSHHPETIDYMAADSSWRMWRDPSGGHSRIERLQPDLDVGQTAYELARSGHADD